MLLQIHLFSQICHLRLSFAFIGMSLFGSTLSHVLLVFEKVARILESQVLLEVYEHFEKDEHFMLVNLAIAVIIDQIEHIVQLLVSEADYGLRHELNVFLHFLMT